MSKKISIKSPEDKLITMLINGVETAYEPSKSYENAEFYLTEKFPEIPCSFNGRGIENYRAALVIIVLMRSGLQMPVSYTPAFITVLIQTPLHREAILLK